MSCNYVVTAFKPTVVTACVTGNFTSPTDLNLILAKNVRLEVYLVTPEGLRFLNEVGIYGKIVDIKFFRPTHEKKDLLFLLTKHYDVMILEFISKGEDIEVITKACGNVADKRTNASETGIKAIIDPKAQVIGLKLYDKVFKIIPLDIDKPELEASSIYMEQQQVQDINFLHGYTNPTLIFIYQDSCGKHVQIREIILRKKNFSRKIHWIQDVEQGAMMIITVPSPICGAIVVGRKSIIYLDGTTYVAILPSIINRSTITCYAKVDNQGLRHLLGDNVGHLFMLYLIIENKPDGTQVVKDLSVEILLGEISIPECITYLGNDMIYVGSRLGDSQLIKLISKADENSFYCASIETFTNLAPIVDMAVMDLENQGQRQIVTCSGKFKEGSLRIIRNVIDIQEHASIDLQGIKNIWTLKVGGGNFDNTLVLSFVGQTKILTLNGEEVEETEILGFVTDKQTLYTGHITNNLFIQITSTSVRLISHESKRVVSKWQPRNKRIINVVACNGTQVLCAMKNELFYMKISCGQIVSKGFASLQHEVACLDISSLDGVTEAKIVAVGLWTDISVRILTLPGLKEINKKKLDSEFIPRSILMTCFEGDTYLFCAMGDGSMYYFTLNQQNGLLLNKKKVILSTQPMVLSTFRSLSTTKVFVCLDWPMVIYSSNHKLIFSNVSLKKVNHMCSLNAESYPNSLVLATDSTIIFGTIDEIQKLHVMKTVPLGETPKWITYQESSQTFGVITMSVDVQERYGMNIVRQFTRTAFCNINIALQSGDWISKIGQIGIGCKLLIFNQDFKVLHTHTLMPTEYAMSLISTRLGDDPTFYFVVGTVYISSEGYKEKGRILLYCWSDSKLTQVAEEEIKGICYSLVEFNGTLLACVINECSYTSFAILQVFEWTAEKKLRWEYFFTFDQFGSDYLKIKDNFVMVGDFFYCLLERKIMERCYDIKANNEMPHFMRVIEIWDDDTLVNVDRHYNVIVLQTNKEYFSFLPPLGFEYKLRWIKEVGWYYLGDIVHVFQHGSLVMQNLGKLSIPILGCSLFGTDNGAIGLVTQIPVTFYEFLRNLENRLNNVIKSVGKIEHNFWRRFFWSYGMPESKEEYERFIDGDLIESFLDLDHDKMAEVAMGLIINDSSGVEKEATVDDLVKIVEDLKRTH